MSGETETGNAVTTIERRETRDLSIFNTVDGFEFGQRMAGALVTSDMVPASYRGKDKIGNALIAIDMAQRTNSNPVMVMQNLHVIEGRPSWSSQFIIAALNSCGLFSPLRFKIDNLGEVEFSYETWGDQRGERVTKKIKIENLVCVAWATEKATGEVLESPPVSMKMAVAEGWYGKKGSKWQTMPELMLRYRAAAFFGRLYAPHVLMGMPTADEVEDTIDMRDITPVVTEPAPDPKPEPSAETVNSQAHKADNSPSKPAPAQAADDSPRKGRPTKEEIDAATARGAADRRAGAPLDACPEERPSIMAAWREGWQAEDDAMNARRAGGDDGGVPFDTDDSATGEALPPIKEPATPAAQAAPSDDFDFGD